jgi:peptidyl-prolyl cis-trans isomerase D
MLEKLSSRLQSILVLVLVIFLGGIFALQFGGTQSDGCTGFTRDPAVAVTVGSEDVTNGDFESIYSLTVGGQDLEAQIQSDSRDAVLNSIVERILLVEEAHRLGIFVTPEQAMQQVVREDAIWISSSVDAERGGPSRMPLGLRGEDGRMDRERFERFVREYLRRSLGEFAEWQAEEITAERMRDVIRTSVVLPPSEVWDAFVREREQAGIKYVRYGASYFRETLNPTDAEIAAWTTAHQAEVDADYTENRHRNADEAAKAAVRARAQAILARARGGEDFAALARATSEDEASARRGGEMGFIPRGRSPSPQLEAALFSVQPGQVSDLVETQFGFHIIKVESRREGNVPEAEAKREIAERLYRDAMGSEAAKQAATTALGRLAAGTITFEQLETELVPPVAEGETAPARAPDAPQVETAASFGPFDAPISGGGNSNAVAQAAFARTLDAPLATAPVQVGNDWVIFRLESLAHANRADFNAEVRERLERGLRRSKEEDAVATHVRGLRARADAAGRVRISETARRYPTRRGEPADGEGGEEEATPAEGAAREEDG